MPRQCGCLGGNENCTFCYGSGYLTGSDFSPSSDARKLWCGGPASPKTSRPLVKCPQCPVRVRENRLARHLHKCHPVPAKPAVTSGVPAPVPAQTTTKTNVASARTVTSVSQSLKQPGEREGTAVVRHADAPLPSRATDAAVGGGSVPSTKSLRLAARDNIAYYHGLVGRQPATPKLIKASKPAALPKTNRPVVTCPQCPNPVLVREDHLARHLRKCHGVLGNRPTSSGTTAPVPAQKYAGRKPQPIPSNIKRTTESSRAGVETVGGLMSSDCDERLNEVDNHRIERRLDGSRDYWQIREEGRFGSHPSFDSCDDESAP